jgi:cytochrome P450
MANTSTDVILPYVAPQHRGLSLPFKISKDPLKFFQNLGDENGSYAWLSLMGKRVLFLNDATAIEHVMHQNHENYHKSDFNECLRPILGNGIFLSEDALWKKQRHDTAPAFAGKHFSEFSRHFNRAADAMMKTWEPNVMSGAPVDISASTMRLALDIVLRTLFHEDSEDALKNMKDALGTMLRMAEKRIWSPVNLPLKLVLKLPKYSKALKFLNEVTDDLISKRKAKEFYPDDLLSRLMDSHGNTAEDKALLRDNILSFLLAGHETTANGLSWTFYEMARHPHAKERAVAEIDRVTVPGQDVDMDMIKALEYTRQCFNEALRLYPPVWTTSRSALKEDVLPLDNGDRILVPKDSAIMLCLYSLHRRKEYWNAPDLYVPERFAPEAEAQRPEYTWLPFGGGARLCLGANFASVESVVALAKVHQRYELALVPEQKIKPEPIITLRPDRPILFKITERIQGGSKVSVEPVPTSANANEQSKCPFHRANIPRLKG